MVVMPIRLSASVPAALPMPRARGRGWFAFALAGAVALLHGCAGSSEPVPELAASDADPTDAVDGLEAGAPAEPCAREAYAVSDALTVYGCEAQVDAVVGDDGRLPHASETDALSADIEPLEAAQGRRLKECQWSSFTDTAKTMLVMCPAEKHVVSGGCYAQTRMVNSAPFESQSVGDLPEHDERYQDLDDVSGWLCTYEGPTQSAGQKAAALCCN